MSYSEIISGNKSWIDEVWEKLDKKLSVTAIKSRNKIPYSTKNGEHDDKSNILDWWTNGFWGGLMWLMYEATKNEEYKISAERNEEILERAFDDVEKLHHDVGFMWHLTSGANYRLTGNRKSRNRALLSAMTLASRYNVVGGFFRCWNDSDKESKAGWTIIDSMMNLPLLYWASNEIGDVRFRNIAIKQADMTMRDHVREDGAVNHIVVHDPDKKDKVLEVKPGQGYAVGSCWSRGNAWALYGFTLSYLYTKQDKYLQTAIKVADYFIEQTKKTDWLPRIDFCQPDSPKYYDSTAGAIAVCGIIELAKILNKEKSEEYLSCAINILKAMEKNWCNWSESEDSILQMGSEAYNWGRHMPIIYGDFYFVEAILKLKGSKFLIW